MKIYGYCRISTKKQSLERQIENISKAYTTAEIVSETYTGTTTERPRWQSLKAKAIRLTAQGESVTIVFDSVSRMSRNAAEGFQEYKELFENGISLIFLKEPHINTETYEQTLSKRLDAAPVTGEIATDKFISGLFGLLREYQLDLAERQIQLAFEQSEKEVLDLHTRTSEGMKASGAAAKISKSKQGTKYRVKKADVAKKAIRKHSKYFGGNLTNTECIKIAGCSRTSFYKYKKELAESTGLLD